MANVALIHLEIPEIPGSSAVEGYNASGKVGEGKASYDCLSWSWGASQKANMQKSTGGAAGSSSIQDVRVTRRMGAASSNLMQACATGRQFPKAYLHCCKTGGEDGKQWTWYRITMDNVIIASVSCGGSGDDGGQETVTLNFGAFQTQYFSQSDETGVNKAGSDNKYNVRTAQQEG